MKKGEFARHCTPFRATSFRELHIRQATITRYSYGDEKSRSIQIVLNFLPKQLRNEMISMHFCRRSFIVRFERTAMRFMVRHINVVESSVTIFLTDSELHAKRFSMYEPVLIEDPRDVERNLRLEKYTFEDAPPPSEPDDLPPF